jgi:hypothetical protein
LNPKVEVNDTMVAVAKNDLIKIIGLAASLKSVECENRNKENPKKMKGIAT